MSGEAVYELVVSVDARRSGEYEDPDKVAMRRQLYEVLDAAFVEAAVRPGGFHREDRGDGILAAIPARVPPTRLLGVWLTELYQQLRTTNRGQLRALGLRVGMHVGPVVHDANGVSGRAVDLACRLADSAAARDALDAADADLVCVVSDSLYADVVRPGGRFVEPELYGDVLMELKEGTVAAWIQVPGRALRAWLPQVRGNGPRPVGPTEVRGPDGAEPGPEPAARRGEGAGPSAPRPALPGAAQPASKPSLKSASPDTPDGRSAPPASVTFVAGDQTTSKDNVYLGPVHIGRNVYPERAGDSQEREPGR